MDIFLTFTLLLVTYGDLRIYRYNNMGTNYYETTKCIRTYFFKLLSDVRLSLSY